MITQHRGCTDLNFHKISSPFPSDLLSSSLIDTSANFLKMSIDGNDVGANECLAAALSKLKISPENENSDITDVKSTKSVEQRSEGNKTDRVQVEKKQVRNAQADVKKRSCTPKEILQYSREKSHSLAHKVKSTSAPLVSKEALTNDLMGLTRAKPVVNRDKKNVEDITKALNEFGLQATTGVAVGEGDLVQRSPIPVPSHAYRATTAPYFNLNHMRNSRAVSHSSLASHTQSNDQQLEKSINADCQANQVKDINLESRINSENNGGTTLANGFEKDTLERNRTAEYYRNYQFHPNLNELPDTLSDFILNFSALYAKQNLGVDLENVDAAGAKDADYKLFDHEQTQAALLTNREECSQPHPQLTSFASNMAAAKRDGVRLMLGGKSKHFSAKKAAPTEAKHVFARSHEENKVPTEEGGQVESTSPVGSDSPRRAGRKLLRDLISNDEFNKAWMWAVRCSQSCTGALYYRDADGDSLLHIVVWHQDLAKVYSLTELMNRENDKSYPKPFDLKNSLNETPLFLAVEKRLKEVVAFGLENSADPNAQALSNDMDAPLHYAASRGMTDIVQVLCQSPLINLDLYNASGLTPLLCALKNHGRRPDDSSIVVDNKSVVETLLKAGADLKRLDSVTGKTAFHYVVESMEPSFMQLFRDHYDKESLQGVVNEPCFSCETPLALLDRLANASPTGNDGSQQLKRKEMLENLLDCGAEWPQIFAHSETDFNDYIYTSFV